MLLKPPNPARTAPPRRSPPAGTAHAHWQRGVRFSNAGRWAHAEREFRAAVAADPADPLHLVNLARAQLRNDHLDDALKSARGVMAMAPGDAIARCIAAECLNRQHRYGEAVDCLRQQPDDVARTTEFHQNLSEALFNAGRHQEAIVELMAALAGNMAHALSHYRLGLSFNALGLKAEATECLRTALLVGMGPGDLAAQGLLAFMERELCRWAHAGDDLAALRRLAAALPDDAAQWASVFAHVTLIDDPLEQLRVARSCTRFATRRVQPFPELPPRALPQRLRVAFLSADFHQHATAVLMAEVFEKLDRARFEISFYSHGPEDGSPMRERLRRAADHFVDVAAWSDLDAARHIRTAGIDVLVELKGHTRDSRIAIAAYRPAPVQVSFLGFPGTTGADFIDYFIGDDIVSPFAHAAHFSERLALLPRCYQPNDRQRPLPGRIGRAEAGLPEGALVLCGFNQPFKLSPEVFDVWCRLLHDLPDAVLWLLQWNASAPTQLRAEAAARGIDPARLVFAPKIGLRAHLSRLALADVFIDSWPCNGHTTASDALWAGVPVVTFVGETFASRVAASLLGAVGLPELACGSVADYEREILALARDPQRRGALRAHLAHARDTAPLFDSRGYARDFGALLRAMAERWSQGLAPDHLTGVTATLD